MKTPNDSLPVATINQKDRPAILTESDRILSELQEELGQLKSRMNQLETEQEQNKDLVRQLAFYEEFAEAQANSAKQEREHNRENYQVIASVMQNLKSPVNEVVGNLSDLISQIEDQETKNTLRECMELTNNVLESFSEVEDFCRAEAIPLETTKTALQLRQFVKEAVVEAQRKAGITTPIKLLIDKNIPEECPLFVDIMREALAHLLQELDHPSAGEISLSLTRQQTQERFGVELFDLVLQINCSGQTPILWGDSWVDAIRQNHDLLQSQGFHLLKVRDHLRNTGGSLEVETKEGRLVGFNCHFPLTY